MKSNANFENAPNVPEVTAADTHQPFHITPAEAERLRRAARITQGLPKNYLGGEDPDQGDWKDF